MKNRGGFTLVELMVSIIAVGILLSIGVVSYGGWRKNTAISNVKTELSHLASVLESSKGFSEGEKSGYPAKIPSEIIGGDKNVTLTYAPSSDGTSYCATGKSTLVPDVQLSIEVTADKAFNNSFGGTNCGSAYPY